MISPLPEDRAVPSLPFFIRLSRRAVCIALAMPAMGWSAPLPTASAPAAQATEAVKPTVSTRTPEIGTGGRPATLAYRTQHYIGSDLRIGDGYLDGGRAMKIQADGRVRSSREILTVDRTRDPELQKQLTFARNPDLQKLDPLDRATRLAQHVTAMYGGKHASDCKVLETDHRNHEVLIGDVAKITGGSGVCRHRALMFKLLADEAGLKAALVRGCWAHTSGKQGEHAWNELHLGNGRVLIVDTMRPSFPLPDTRSKAAARYFTVDHAPTYAAENKPIAPAATEATVPAAAE